MDVILRSATGHVPAPRPLLRLTTAGDGRRPRGGRRRGAVNETWRCAAWAARIAARHRAAAGAWNGLATVLLRTPVPAEVRQRAPVTMHVTTSWRIGFPLHLVLKPRTIPAHEPMRQSGSVSAPMLVAAATQAGRLTETLVTRISQREHGIVLRESTEFERILARREYVHAAGAAPSTERRPEPPPVPRVVARPALMAAPAAQLEPVVAPLLTPLRYWDEPLAQPAPALDVERLTDQVIDSIDRRVVAARERLGKG